jgi:hypothetical protein
LAVFQGICVDDAQGYAIHEPQALLNVLASVSGSTRRSCSA